MCDGEEVEVAETADIRLPAREQTFPLFVHFAESDRAWVFGYLLEELGVPRDQVVTKDDFRAGEPVLVEIERCITRSLRTVIVVSQAFLADEWAVVGEQLAAHLTLFDNASRLVPVFLEKVTAPLRIDFRVRLDCTDPQRWDIEVERLRRDLRVAAAPEVAAIPCPYPGMRHYTAAHASDFYGREEQIEQLAGRLTDERFLLVVGPSGSGKSSLIFAGLLPALLRSRGDGLRVVACRPGKDPLAALAVALGVPDTVLAEDRASQIDEALGRPDPGLALVVVDQLEEMFAQATSDLGRKFLLLIERLRRYEHVLLLLSMRADFYADLMVSPLWPLPRRQRAEVAPLRGRYLARALTRPAEASGVCLQAGLLPQLLAHAADEPGAMPLLQEVMRQLWWRRRRKLLTIGSYEELAGQAKNGLAGALATHADAVLESFTPEQRSISRRILLRLVQLGEGRGDTRRQERLEALRAETDDPGVFRETIGALTVEGLLTTGGDAEDGSRTVDLAHEALIAHWPTFGRWLEQDRAGLVIQHRLALDAQEWEELERDPGGLYRGAQLAITEDWAGHHQDDVNRLEREFVSASVALAAREAAEKRRGERRLRGLAAGLAVLLLVSVAATGVAVKRSFDADSELRLATSRQLAAQSTSARDDQLRKSILLSLAALHTSDTSEAREALLGALEQTPGVRRILASGPLLDEALTFSPDGRRLATGDATGRVVIWDSQSGAALRFLAADSSFTTSVAYSPDGRTLATAGSDGQVLLWDAESGVRIGEPLRGNTGWVDGVCFSPDGRFLVAADKNGTVLRWELSTRAQQTLDSTPVRVNSVTFLDGSAVVWARDDGVIASWDERTGRVTTRPVAPGIPIRAVVMDHARNLVATADASGAVRLWSLPDMAPVGRSMVGHTGPVWAVAFAPDDKNLASVGLDRTLNVWNVQTQALLHQQTRAQGDDMSAVAFSRDGVLATGAADGTTILWDFSYSPLLRAVARQSDAVVLSVAISPLGGTAAAADSSGRIAFWDLASLRLRLPPIDTGSGYINSIAYGPDGRLLASSGEDGTVRFWDTAVGRQSGEPLRGHLGKAVNAVAFSPDGKTLASGGRDQRVVFWDVAGRTATGTALWNDSSVLTVAYSHAGSLLAVGTNGGEVAVWDLEHPQPQLLWRHTAGAGQVGSVVFSADDAMVVTAGSDHVILRWDTRTGEHIKQPLTAHSDEIWGLDLDPSRNLLASASPDGTVRLWEQIDGDPIGLPLRTGDEQFMSVALDPAARFALSGSVNGKIMMWDIALEDWEQTACAIVGGGLTPDEWAQYVGASQKFEELCPS